MTNLHKALYGFWSGFSYAGQKIPAYLSGHVPDGAAFPYFTFEVVDGDFYGNTVLTAYIWCRAASGANVNAQRAAILDDVAHAISRSCGARLLYSGGMAMLYRNAANFQSYLDDPDDKDIVGGRISYEIYFFQGGNA